MAKNKLSRELKPAELSDIVEESMPEATTVQRQPPDARPIAGGAEHRSGDEEVDEPSSERAPEEAPAIEDPPRGLKPEDPPQGRK